jgi:hypothetical protein
MTYFYNVGVAFDMMLNALLGGQAGQTISYRAAVNGLVRHKRFWCVFCRFLSWLVQRNHCEDQLCGIIMDGEQEFRAFIGLLFLAALMATPVVLLWRILF